MTYFSEREEGERPRQEEVIGDVAWGGIQELILARISDGSFGAGYPESCEDGGAVVGTDNSGFWRAMKAEIPDLPEYPWLRAPEQLPRSLTILDMIEFCWRCIGKPIAIGHHSYFRHHHLRYDIEIGQAEFCETVNRIFRRNGLAFELREDGQIVRLVLPVLRKELTSAHFDTGDSELDRLLETACRKFLDPDEITRREALEALWDAWERLKTLGVGANKKAQVTSLLDETAGSNSPKLREALEREATELTWVGNNLRIRHAETSQERLAKAEHVDYLFHRLFALILGILRLTKHT